MPENPALPPFICFGHRGARGHEPENTLRSVLKALELGANGIEIDVHRAGGELIVIHDDTLDRTTSGTGPVGARTLAELRSLDAGKGERLPTLDEIIRAVGRRAVINVELKGPATAAPAVAELARAVDRGGEEAGFLISSFDHDQLRIVRRLNPRLRLGVLFERLPGDYLERCHALGAFSVHPPLEDVNERVVAACHERGWKVFVYTVNTIREIQRMRKLGVDGLFTDYPELVGLPPGS